MLPAFRMLSHCSDRSSYLLETSEANSKTKIFELGSYVIRRIALKVGFTIKKGINLAKLEAVMAVELQIRGPYPIGEQRLAVNIEGGSLLGIGAFEGKLAGNVIAPSGDVAVVQKTGTLERNVRLTARMEDGSHLQMNYGGRTVPTEEFQRKVAAQEIIKGSEVYFKIQPTFRTESERHAWLNDFIFIGEMEEVVFPSPEIPGWVKYVVYRVL